MVLEEKTLTLNRQIRRLSMTVLQNNCNRNSNMHNELLEDKDETTQPEWAFTLVQVFMVLGLLVFTGYIIGQVIYAFMVYDTIVPPDWRRSL